MSDLYKNHFCTAFKFSEEFKFSEVEKALFAVQYANGLMLGGIQSSIYTLTAAIIDLNNKFQHLVDPYYGDNPLTRISNSIEYLTEYLKQQKLNDKTI